MPSVATAQSGPLPTKFADLVRLHAPRAIHDDAEYQDTMSIVRSLLDETSLSGGQADYLETLAVLAEAYERVHHWIGDDAARRSGLDMLRYVVSESETTVDQLANLLGVTRRWRETFSPASRR